jgi:SAM-dependent methyltransferase
MKKCVLCKSTEYKKLFDIKQFSLLKCKKCGLVRTRGQQTISYHHYHRDEVYKDFEKLFKNIYQKRVNIIIKFKKQPGRVLDVGTSTGTMLEIFKDAGWEVWGVEPSESAKIARKRGVKILRTTFEKAKLPKNYFDVVILNHTLEHMENPIIVLKKAKMLLKNKGIILVDVPNFGGLSAKILKERWPFILPREHLFHFTPETLRKILEKTGFKVIHWQTQSGIFECANPFFEIFYSLTTFKKRFLANILGFPGALIATLANCGASLSMIGQKK